MAEVRRKYKNWGEGENPPQVVVGTEILYFKFTEPKLPAWVSFPQRAAIFILRHSNGGSEAEVKGFR